MAREPLVFAFHDDTLHIFERADQHSASWFGGPPETRISGHTFGPRPLHLIASLGSLHVPALSKANLISLPLIYGLQYDACEMTYHIGPAGIELLQLTPTEPSDDFPYRNYSPLLPYLPLRLDDVSRRVGYDEFAERFPNMPEIQTAELIVAVPPPATIGMSLWGSADGDDVTILFECDLQKRVVKATNVTS